MAASALRDILAGAVILGILVLLHEWGHFIAAKLCGVRVDVFSIGFGPRIWGVKRGDTDYRVSALPLGGYVRMAGDNPVEERSGAEYEFLSRPRWQRFLIAVAGPAVNIVTTFVIFWAMYAFVGMPFEPYVHQPADVAAVSQNAPSTGVKPGDRIVELNGVATPTWEKAGAQMDKAQPGDMISAVVLRNGVRQTLALKVPNSSSAVDSVLGYPALAPVIDETSPGSPAEKAGLKAGDTILSVNGKAVITWPQLVDLVQSADGNPIHLVVRRDGKEMPLDITPIHTMNSDGQMAWMIGASRKAQQESYEHQGVLESVKDAALETRICARLIGGIFTGLFSGRVSVHDLAGPVGIVQMSGQAAAGGLPTLLQWMAYISLDLGLLNLLPIPILDGGHVLMLAIEGTIRRDLSITFKERFVQVGLVFLLGLFAFVMYNDILRVAHVAWR
ncbi:MAG: RIP metalloprotease RseP [Candidatus Acidiferrales bacterium]|jgi:regulator of sigma E protease